MCTKNCLSFEEGTLTRKKDKFLTKVLKACTNTFLLILSDFPNRRSSILPGVPMMMFPPSSLNMSISAEILDPPMNSCCVKCGTFSRKVAKTWLIWLANSRVGLKIKAPIWWGFKELSSFDRISRMGRRNAKVFPLPVTASATTSFLWRNWGIAAAWKTTN